MTTETNIITELINRYEKRKRECFKTPNPYYKVGEMPSEYMHIKLKINELQKLTKNN